MADEVMDLFDNEVTRAVRAMEGRLANIPGPKLAEMDEAAQLGMSELLAFGPLPSLALASGIISSDGALALHAIHGDFKGSSLAQRMIYLSLMEEISRKCM